METRGHHGYPARVGAIFNGVGKVKVEVAVLVVGAGEDVTRRSLKTTIGEVVSIQAIFFSQ